MISELHIQTALRNGNGSTYLKNGYCTPPYKIADITEDKKQKTLHLMIMSSSPGILDEDHHRMTMELAERCSLQLHTQSYQRLFRMKKGAAQQTEIRLAEGSSLCYLPLPVVPHEASHFTGKNKIVMSPGCSLLWGEVLTCGRKLNGEVFRFSRYQNLTEVFMGNRLVIKENLLLQPSSNNIAVTGQWEGYTHQAGLIFLNETVPVNELIEKLSEEFSAAPGIAFGITAAPANGVLVRLLGHKAEALYGVVTKIAKRIKEVCSL